MDDWRLAPTRRPAGRAIGYQQWRHLLFLHWRAPPEVVRPLVPIELELDTWEGDAWIGLVPFTMRGVRPWWSPGIPGVSNFHETNVRTYVHHQGEHPGVWFLSLDAASSLAVRIARGRWSLPYFRAQMQLHIQGQQVNYRSRRLWPEPSAAECEIQAQVGSALDGRSGGDHPDSASPGSLEFFLAERYYLYALSQKRGLLRGQVHHRPYPLHLAQVDHCRQTLLPAAGLDMTQPPCHALFSPGVDVEVFPLMPVPPGPASPSESP